MRLNIMILCSLIYSVLPALKAAAQLPFHYFLDYKGKVQLIQITGEPYEMTYYRQYQPLAMLKPGKEDTSGKVIRSRYGFDHSLQKIKATPSRTDTFPRFNHDFSENKTFERNYFTDAYPFWQDYNNSLFSAHIQKGKFYYEYRYVHYSPERSASMPPPGPWPRKRASTPSWRAAKFS